MADEQSMRLPPPEQDPPEHPVERIAAALERIADVLEEQTEISKGPMMDYAAVIKHIAEEVQK